MNPTETGAAMPKANSHPIRMLQAVTVLLAMMQVQCSFMPDGLKEFFDLPLPEVERGSYQWDGVTMSYVRTGNPDGVPVVLVHGSPGSWQDWKLVIDRPRLMPRFNLIAVNRPGWNGQMKPTKVFPDLSIQSQMLRPVMDLGSEKKKIILVGHSLGGAIVLRMALDYPDKVAALILLAPSLDPDLDAVLWYNTLADYMVIKMFLPDILAKSNDEIMALPDGLRSLGSDLVAIDKPVVLVHGKKDKLVHPGNASYAKSRLANARYREVLLPNFGHLIPHFRPAEVVLAIELANQMAEASEFASPHRSQGF